jgi:valyl-tRNA synthetase
MSKSLGNSPDPLDLIANFGADAVRTGMLFSSPAGNDLLYDEKLVEQGRNFANKVWNAFRLVNGWTSGTEQQPEECRVAIEWFESRINQSLRELNDHFSKFRMSDALMTIYKLIWDDFCSWYLEMIKPEFGKPIDGTTYKATITFFETLLKALHPFMPFITEELWHELQDRGDKDCIIVASWPRVNSFDNSILQEGAIALDVIKEVRNVRNTKGLSPKEALPLHVKNGEAGLIQKFWPVIRKLSNISEISFVSQAPAVNATSFIVRVQEFYIPLEGKLDSEKEKETLLKELDYLRGFIASVDKKLSNEKFVSGAKPEVVEIERKKKADAESKIRAIEESLGRL